MKINERNRIKLRLKLFLTIIVLRYGHLLRLCPQTWELGNGCPDHLTHILITLGKPLGQHPYLDALDVTSQLRVQRYIVTQNMSIQASGPCLAMIMICIPSRKS